jgi:AcrR family transcriptional regulator
MEGSRSSRSRPLCKATRTPGKREANKLDKLNRAKWAARELLTTVGYDEATTRQIVEKAGVALGTVFSYETTKRDLLFLVSNDLLDEARRLAEASFQRNRSIQHNFVVFCAFFYKVLRAQPELSKLVFRELLFYDSGIHSMRALANRARTLKTIEALVVNAQERGEIRLPNRRTSRHRATSRFATQARGRLRNPQGRCSMVISTSLLPMAKEGKGRMLAYSDRTRSEVIPEIPTVAEQGHKDFQAYSRTCCLCAPARRKRDRHSDVGGDTRGDVAGGSRQA